MLCPFCNHDETKVIDSRLISDGRQVRRRRECLKCQDRYTTYESAELVMPAIIKRDGRRKPFDEANLKAGMQRALEKRPVSVDQIEIALGKIKHKIQVSGVREIPSQVIGEFVMKELRMLDEVAYVRFASVYRCFQDISDFNEEIDRMHDEVVDV